MQDIQEIKSGIRKEYLEKRKQLSSEDVCAKSLEIFEKWKNRFPLTDVVYIHLFQSIEKFNEVNTSLYFEYLRTRFKRIRTVVPVVNNSKGVMVNYYVTERTTMRVTKWGIPEPELPARIIQPFQIDMVLVPLLACDKRGYRIGYGKGFYDKFLSLVRPDCKKIGLCFDEFVSGKDLPEEPTDVPLDYLITDKSIYTF